MTRHSVIIPLVTRASATGELLDIYCEASFTTEEDKKDRGNGMNPVTEGLRNLNLHKQGRQAFAATEKLLPAQAKQQLNLTARKIKYGNFLANIDEGDSAGLGIALALLMNAGNCAMSTVIASGTIEIDVGDNRFDANIGAVRDLPQKFAVVLAKSILSDGAVFFIPAANVAEDDTLLESETVKSLEALRITIFPVATLREAAEYLKIPIAGRNKPPVKFYWLALVVLVFAISGFSLDLLPAQQRLTVNFVAETSPFIVCNPSGRFPTYKKLAVSGLTPLASVQDTLGWHLQVDAIDKNSVYFLAVAFVGEQSGLKLLPINKQSDFQRDLRVDEKWSWIHQLDNKAEAGVLIFMVKQERFDLTKLREKFSAQFAHNPYNVSLAQDFLKHQADASQVYFFETTQQTSVCKATHG